MTDFAQYVPRGKKVKYGWGGYHVKVGRVEWQIMPGLTTTAGAYHL
jgi:hypothetical protein